MSDTPVTYVGHGTCDECDGGSAENGLKLWRLTELGITYQLCTSCLVVYGFQPPKKQGDLDE